MKRFGTTKSTHNLPLQKCYLFFLVHFHMKTQHQNEQYYISLDISAILISVAAKKLSVNSDLHKATSRAHK